MRDTKMRQSPDHLRRSTRDFWLAIQRQFCLEDHHYQLLTLACEALDRAHQARLVIEDKGLTYIDRFGQPKVRPEVAVERRNRSEFARLLREIGLDHAELPRPPRIGGGS